MNIAEELDKLAGEGRVTCIQLTGNSRGGWQCYINIPGTGSQVARTADSPTTALQAALETLPGCEEYDRKYGTSAVTARAIAENKPAEPAGVFD